MACRTNTWLATWMLLAAALSATSPVSALLGIPDFLELGDCAKVVLKENFDPVKYAGLWFDIESVPNQYQHTKKCVTQNYTWTGEYMNVGTRGLTDEDEKVRQGAVMHVEDYDVEKPDPAYMTVDASGVPAAPYQIIATDYRTYSCVYSCLEYFGFRAEFAWVFGRTPTLPPSTIARCHKKFTGMGVDPKKMFPIVQGETCPYYEKLDEMLATSERQLLRLLGPDVPTTSTTTTSTVTPKLAHEEVVLEEIEETVRLEEKIVKEIETKVEANQEVNRVAVEEKEEHVDYSAGLQSSSSCLLLSLLCITVWILH
ncbi:crustacyanin-A2 subunit-like [Penaeus indicus]|uniref:crustacyanin-A2 subunit-like n=1 Tax=Penaeus indicus TaxID=29960 RepID=UPI00300C6B62